MQIERDRESIKTFNDIMSNYGNRNKIRNILSKTKKKVADKIVEKPKLPQIILKNNKKTQVSEPDLGITDL
jgi:undecaprenyl pyrophosphate synthase